MIFKIRSVTLAVLDLGVLLLSIAAVRVHHGKTLCPQSVRPLVFYRWCQVEALALLNCILASDIQMHRNVLQTS